MIKKLFILAAMPVLAACAGINIGPSKPVTFEKTGEVAGTAGLGIAAKKCAPHEGTPEWQMCVAHYDGLYTKSGSAIKRSYVLSEDAPKQTGRIEKCSVTATWDGVAEVMTYSSCERPTRFR